MLLATLSLALAARPGHPLDGRTWIDETGREVGAQAWQGSPELIATFYRGCSVMCPRTLARLREVEQAFRQRAVPLEILLVTLDPGADTPARLRAFKQEQGLSGHWHFLNGRRAQVVAFCRENLGWVPLYDGEHVDHGTGFLLLDGDGKRVLTLPGWAFQMERLFEALKPPS